MSRFSLMCQGCVVLFDCDDTRLTDVLVITVNNMNMNADLMKAV